MDEFGVSGQTERDLVKRKTDLFMLISCAKSEMTTLIYQLREKLWKNRYYLTWESALFEWFKQKRVRMYTLYNEKIYSNTYVLFDINNFFLIIIK